MQFRFTLEVEDEVFSLLLSRVGGWVGGWVGGVEKLRLELTSAKFR